MQPNQGSQTEDSAIPMQRRFGLRWLGGLTLVGIHVSMTLAWIYWRERDGAVSRENGPMENFQAICLFLGIGVFLVSALKNSDAAGRIFSAGLALFYGTFLILEVDLREIDSKWLVRLTNGPVRDAWLGLLWGFAAWRFARARHAVLQVFRNWVWTASGTLLCLSGLFWLMSAMIDKSILIKKDLFKEEILEVNAALLMLVAAVLASKCLPK